MSEDDISRLFRIRRTVMQMLRDRGYLVLDLEINMNKLQFLEKFGEGVKREDLVINKAKKNDPADQVHPFPFRKIPLLIRFRFLLTEFFIKF